MAASINQAWIDFCEKSDFDGFIELIGAELIISELSILSIYSIMSRLKYSVELSDDTRIDYTKKKSVQKMFVKDLYKMQKLGLIEIKSKIDSARYEVEFNWLKQFQESK